MKKIILFVLIILSLLAIVSCKDYKNDKETNPNNNTAKEEIVIEDLYFIIRGHNKFGRDGKIIKENGPVKINPVTKIVTSVCKDALCDHGTDCPFYGVNNSNIYVTDNYIFYTVGSISYTGERNGSVKLRVYDMLNGTVSEIAEYRDNLNLIIGTGSYIYFQVYQFIDETSDKIEYIMCRADAKTSNVIEIPTDGKYTSENIFSSLDIYTIYDNKIYWEKMEKDGTTHYTTDLDGNNKEAIDYGVKNKYGFGALNLRTLVNTRFAGGYAYYLAMDEEAFLEKAMTIMDLNNSVELERIRRFDRTLYKLPLDGSGDLELIAEHISSFSVCVDKIYYTAPEDNPEPIYNGEIRAKDSAGKDQWNWLGGKVYVMNLDGTEQRLVCETEYDIRGIYYDAKTINDVDYLVLAFNVIIDRWFNSAINEYVDVDIYQGSDDYLLLVNASTSEVTRLSMPE